MFTKPDDLARAALDLLSIARSRASLSTSEIAAAELGAAMLANHVWDWHRRANGIAKRDKAALDAFVEVHPEWPLLNRVANGVKHATEAIADNEQIAVRDAEWEDADFWPVGHSGPTLFVEADGRARAVRALVLHFAERYLEVGSSPGPIPASSF